MSPSLNNSTMAITGTRPNRTELQVRMAFLWLIIVVGLVSNAFIFAVIKSFHGMRTTTNYLLVNVAAADITTLIFTAIHLLIPMKRHFPTGFLGSFLCKFLYTNNITLVTLLVTTLTLTLLAIERYHAMTKPLLTTKRIPTEKIAYFLTGIWMTAIIMVTPLFVSIDHRPNTRPRCSPGDDSDTMRVYVTFLVITLTLVPFICIACCYSKIVFGLYWSKTICSRFREVNAQRSMEDKKRLLIVLVVLTSVFFVAFVPYGVMVLVQFNGITSKPASRLKVFLQLRSGVQYLTLLNCSLNPFIYAIPSANYRCCLKYIVKKIFCRDTNQEFEAMELRRRKTVSSI